MSQQIYAVNRMVPRVVNDTEGAYDLASAVTMILSIPQHLAHNTSAIVAMRGQGEWWRERDAIRVWQHTDCQARQLVIAGSNSLEATWTDPTFDQYQREPYNLRKLDGVHLHGHAHHTAEQADHVINHMQKHQLASMTLCTSPYHMVRAFMTMVASMDRGEVPWIPVIPLPTAVPPSAVVPEENQSAWQLLPGELRRITTYQPIGDAVSLPRLQQYLAWLWQHPLLQQ